ncbi:MAG: LEPR-XLL domain-containing protein, partial [Verrucomicrobiota bacterium]
MSRKANRTRDGWKRFLMGGKSNGGFRGRQSGGRRGSGGFTVEPLEPRLLLNAALYDASVSEADSANDVADARGAQDAIKTQFIATLTNLGQLGEALNSDGSLNNTLDSSGIPLLDQTLRDVLGDDVGRYFNWADEVGEQLDINAYLSNYGDTDVTMDDRPDSAGLALRLQTALDSSLFGSGMIGTITDNSTAFNLQLDVVIGLPDTVSVANLKLGEAAEEFNLRLEDGTSINITNNRSVSFSIGADLSILDPTTLVGGPPATPTTAEKLTELGKDGNYWVDFGNYDATSIAQHTTTTYGGLDDFGIQIGILGGQQGGTGAGAWVDASDGAGGAGPSAQFLLDVTTLIDFSGGESLITADSKFDLAEFKLISGAGTPDWTIAYDLQTPTGQASVIGGGFQTNTVDAIFQVEVANPAGDTFIGGLDGVTGQLQFSDDNLFDDRAPLVNTDATLSAFSRIAPKDLLNMVDSTVAWAEALDNSELFRDQLPFLNLDEGDAFAFGEAFRQVFLAQLQSAEQVLTSVNAPSTWRDDGSGGFVRDPLDYTGGTAFSTSVNGGTWTTILVNEDLTRTSLQDIVDDINTALIAASVGGATGVQARVTDTDSPRIEFFAADPGQFAFIGFQAAGDGVLDIGINAYGEVVLANDSVNFGNGVAAGTEYQLGGIVFDSSSAIDVTDFSTVRTFDIAVNGAAAVTVTIPIQSYSGVGALVARMRDVLEAEGLFNGATGEGVVVDVLDLAGGGQGIRVYGTGEIYGLSIAGTGLSQLKLTPSLQASNYIDFSITVDGTATSYRTYLSGNRTTGLAGTSNVAMSDLADDIRYGLKNTTFSAGVLTPLLDQAAGTGIDVRGDNSGALQFFARNPGEATGKISQIAIQAISGGLGHLAFGTTPATNGLSASFALSKRFISPDFTSLQEFAAVIAAGPLAGAAQPVFDTSRLSITFPIEFDYTPTSLTGVAAVDVLLEAKYGEISQLATDSSVDVDRTTNSSFGFEVGLVPDTSVAEVLTLEVPVGVADWDGQIQADGLIRVILDDGVIHDLRVDAIDTTDNTDASDFAADVQAAINADAGLIGKVSVTAQAGADSRYSVLVFTADPAITNTRMFQVLVPERISSSIVTPNEAITNLGFVASSTNLTTVIDTVTATNLPSFSLNAGTRALFHFDLFDGNSGDFVLNASETVGNASMQDLLDDLNFAIQQSAELSTEFEGKIEAFDDSGKVGFRLNANVFPDDGSYVTEAWTFEVVANYFEPQPNAVSTELYVKEITATSAITDVRLSIISRPLEGPNPFLLSNPAVFEISINGSDYVTVTVPGGVGTPTMANLISDINAALAATPVIIGATYDLSDFLRAGTFGGGSRVAIFSLDNSDPLNSNPIVRTFRFVPDDSIPTNTATTTLGFLTEEQRIGARGGEVFLNNIALTGTASVTNQQVSAKGHFGFVAFEAGDGRLDLVAKETTSFGGRLTLVDLNTAAATNNLTSISTQVVDPTTFATLELRNLSFPVDPDTGEAFVGLAFGPGATITLKHDLTGMAGPSASKISDFANLPAPDLVYNNTLGMEMLYTVGFEDIIEGLLRTAEYISDQMRIDPDGAAAGVNAFQSKLLFVKSGLVDVFDLGYELEQYILRLESAQPASLQELKNVMAGIFQLNLADIGLSLSTTYNAGALESASIDLSLPFVQAFATSLPLFVDLAQLRNRSSDPEIVDDYLAGLSALASTGANPMEVELSILADLDLDLGIQVVRGGISREPRAVLYQTSQITTLVNLAGENFNGDLPVGNARFRLSNGMVAVNKHGEVAVDDANGTPGIYNQAMLQAGYVQPAGLTVDVATTADLGGTFTNPTLANGRLDADVSGQLVIDGVSVSIGDLVLVNHQGNVAYNGVYSVIRDGSGAGVNANWRLRRVSAANTAAELDDLFVSVTGGSTYAGRDFIQVQDPVNLGVDAVRFARFIDPATFEINLQGDQILPYLVRVATTGELIADFATIDGKPGLQSKTNQSLNSILSTLANGRQVVGIDGVPDIAVNDLILVKDQNSSSNIEFQNGIYRVKTVGNASEKWELVRVGFADTGAEFDELRVAVAEGRDNGGFRFIQDNNVPALSAGVSVNFSNSLERVYSNADGSGGFNSWAIVNPNGQGQALLPMIIVITDENGNEILITKDTSQLSDAQKADSAFVATLPDFDPVNIRVLNYDDGTGVRTGLDRFFDVTVPANTPGVPAPAVFFTDPTMPWDELPPLGRNIPPVDVLNILRDPFIMGEALDLALFNLQFAIDQALGNYIPLLGTDLPSSTVFIETWRSDFTNRVRDELRNNKLKPINAIIDSLYAILGPGGEGYLTTKSEIVIETLDAAEVATIWDPNAASNYDLTPANEEFEVVPGSAVSLQFSLDLVKTFSDLPEININRIDLSQTGTGLVIDTATVSQTISGQTVTNTPTTGGINLRRAFTLHLGFGVDLQEGFYLYNPADDPTDGVDTPLMSVDIEAVLDGDINTAGVQIFEQSTRSSTLNQLQVQVADAGDTPGPYSLGTDFLSASGFYGTFDFFLNQGSGGTNLNRTTIQDMQGRNTLGLDPALPVAGQSQIGSFQFGVLSFETDGDLDLHLFIEGGKPGTSFGGGQGIPDIQTEFTLQIRYGIGASQLNYLGVLAPDGVTSLAVASMAAYNVVLADQSNGTSNATDDQLELSAQVFRYNRQLIDGAAFDFYNIQVDVEGFLQGTIFESLLKFSDGIKPIRPLIDFLLEPLPGTEWMASPFVLGDFLGSGFTSFASTIVRLDDMVRGIGVGSSADPKPSWAKPRVRMGIGGSIWNKIKTTAGKDSRLTKERNNIEKYKNERDTAREKARQNREDDEVGRGIRFVLDGETDDRSALKRMKDSLNEKATTPNKFSKRFEKFRNDGFAKNENDGKLKAYVKKKSNEALTLNNDSAKAKKSPIFGITGGGFRLDFAKQENVVKILMGQEANLTFLELPRVEVGVAVTKSFPLPAFPPLIATVGFSISVNINLKFGWDTEGFYWSTLNLDGQPSPAFGILARFNVGVALSLGLIEAGIEAFFELQVDFNWNDVTVDKNKANAVSSFQPVDTEAYPFPPSFGDPGTPGYGKLRNSQIDYLKNLPGADLKMGNLFDVTLTGRIGLTFYVDLTIPVPFVGPITKRILEKTFAMDLFQVTFFAEKPGIQLATVSGSTLDLNTGSRAALRIFNDTRAVNEVYTLTSDGVSGSTENITVTAILNGVTYTQSFTGISLVRGSLGSGESIIDASALTRALVDLNGGSGNSTLYAGKGNSGGGKNRLTGGEGTATLFGSVNRSSILRAGQANTTIIGGTAADDIYSGQRSDVLDGGGGGDTYYFENGFGRDRLIVTGLGNTADFSGVTSDLTFDLGRLVQSAKTGLNTVFFAPDASGSNSIDSWIGGSGDDRFNTFFFAPDKTLNLEGGAGADFYAVTLGNPTKRYFADTNPGASTLLGQMDPRNIGHININDLSNDGWVLIKQTFPERISYSVNGINNGREQAVMSGINRVDLDAGNATVVWGDLATEWLDLGIGSTVTAGTIEMRSSVEAEGLTLNLKRSFSVTERLVMRNNSNLQLNIQNIDPLGDSSLFIGPAPLSQSPEGTVGIYSSDTAVFDGSYDPSSWNGNGSGYIDINLPTGSLFNVSSIATGVIEALGANGEVAIAVRDTIGFDTDPVKINATWLAAKTTTSLATLAQGINIISDRDIKITKIRDIDGLSTISGAIRLAVAPGQKIVLGRLVAGGGRDVILEADEVTLDVAGRTEWRPEVESYLQPVTVNYSYQIWEQRTVPVWFWTYYYWEQITIYSSYTYYVTAYRDVQVAYTIPPIPGGGIIDTSGDVYIRNVTDDYDIRVADVVPQANTLNVTQSVLNTITNQAKAIIIGRDEAETLNSGVVSILNYDFDTSLILKGAQINILGQDAVPGTSALTSTNFFELHAYEGAGDGGIHFNNANGSSSVVAPSIFATAFRDISVNTLLSSTPDNGLIRLIAGSGASTTGAADNTGDLNVGAVGSVQATGLNSNVILKSGAAGGAMSISGNVTADDRITLEALGGGVTVNAPARLSSSKLNFEAALSSVLRTAVDDIISGRIINGTLGGAADLTIDELDGLTLTLLETDAGTVDVTAGGAIVVDKVIGGTLPSLFDVTLDAQGGALTRVVPNPGEANVVGDALVVTALGGVTLDTAVNSLDIRALNTVGKGDVAINNVNGQASPLLINRILTNDGAIQVDTEGSMNARLVRSQTDAAANTIVLRTRDLFGGAILLDVIDAGNTGDVTIDAGGFTLGSLPSGGTVLSDSSTTGRITANNLIVNARGYPVFVDTFDLGIDLRTTVNNVSAKTFTAGNPAEANSAVGIRIDETDAIGLVELETFLGDITVTAGGTITHDSVRAPNRDIFLTSTGGSILSNDINGDTFQKIFGRELTALATGDIVMDTTVDGITADSTVAGDLTITESDSVLLRSITTNVGDIDITSGEFAAGVITKGGSIQADLVRAGAGGADDVTLTAYGTLRTAGQPVTTLLPVNGGKIHGALFTATSYGALDLITNVATLIAENFTIGNMTIVEDDAVNVQRLVSTSGSIDLTAGGTIVADYVESINDIDQTNTFDINLRATAGDILIDRIDAGGNFNDVTLTADLGSINEVNPQDAPDGFVAPDNSGIDLVADHAIINAFGSIGGLRPIEIRLNSLEAHSNNNGAIDLNEFDAIDLQLVDTADGSITVDAGGQITIGSLRSLTDDDANDVVIHNTSGDILIDEIFAGIS